MRTKINLKMALIMAVLLLGLATTIAVGGTIYVDPCATGANDGSSWTNAYNYLQDGLADANSNPDVNEIWVADGTYKPDANTANPGSDDRAATFGLINGVGIYGGYAGFGEPDPNERDVELYETILSGDINTPDVNTDNSYHVVTGSGTDSNAVLDGFTVTAGNADGSNLRSVGGGMYNYYDGSPTVTNCKFTSNSADDYGGGMYNKSSSSPTVTNCTFSDNSAKYGGGMYNSTSSSPTVVNCTFTGNYSENQGAGMYNYVNSSPVVVNCTFCENVSNVDGSGMYSGQGSEPNLTNCVFSGNWAERWGGGMFNTTTSELNITNCTFKGNRTNSKGGGICNYDNCAITLTNCILWGNTAPDGNEIALFVSSTIDVNYCDIKGGEAEIYTDISCTVIYNDDTNIEADPRFVAPDTNDLHLLSDSPCIDVGDNTAVPPDTADLDSDGDTGEVTPWDLDGTPRFIDVLSKIDAGNGTPPIVDMGAYEWNDIIYVDADAPPVIGNGLSWNTAFMYLQDGLAVATAGHAIWVAEGIYKPDEDEGGNVTPNDRTETFQLINGVGIYGGYAGYGATDPNARDIDRYESVLSGDLADNDVEVLIPGDLFSDPCRAENSRHIVTGSGTNATAVLDGFTITGGYANGSGGSEPNNQGGGMYNISGSPTLADCNFTCNMANRQGGGMWNNNSNPRLTNCTLSVNLSAEGGGMHNHNSSPTLTGCAFNSNQGSNGGGGMYNHGETGGYSSPTLTNCTFSGNSGRNGGGMFNQNDASPRLTNCTFTDNTSSTNGGGMSNGGGCSPDLVNCTFIGNWADAGGGGMYSGGLCNPSLTNCIFMGNSTASSGGGMYDQSQSLTLTNCVFSGNSAGISGGGITNAATSNPAVTNCTFSGNSAANKGGGIYCLQSNTLTLRNCILWGNTADVNGPQIALNNSPLNVNYCDVQGGVAAVHTDGSCSITWGGSNIDSDPNFVRDPCDSGDGWGVGDNDDFGDLHLWPGSPCIDAGDNTAVPGGVTTDIDYDPRFVDGDGNTTEIVDMGSDEVVWAGEEDVGPGESVTLNPDGGPDDPNLEALVVFDNNSVSEDANITVVEMSSPPNPSQGYFQALGSTLRIETSLADGEFLMTVMIPFDADDLDGVEPTDVDLRYYKPGTGPGTGWMLAVAGNTEPQPDPVGDRFDVLPVSDELGDYGVYWNPITQRGFVWANVDHTTDFSPVAHDIPGDFEPDGGVDFVDFAKLALAWRTGEGEAGYDSIYDISVPADGVIDEKDLKIFTDNWLAGI